MAGHGLQPLRHGRLFAIRGLIGSDGGPAVTEPKAAVSWSGEPSRPFRGIVRAIVTNLRSGCQVSRIGSVFDCDRPPQATQQVGAA